MKLYQGRDFTYSQKTVSNGSYEFIVPYSTEGPIPGETNFDTKPIGRYILTVGNVSREVPIEENSVLSGKITKVDLT